MRILVIEDEEKIANFIARGLREEAYEVVTSPRGDEGLELARAERFDLILLDVILPGLDGVALVRTLRTGGNMTPVLMLTARDAVADKVTGLDAGADDYLTKPFAFEELLARIRVLLRRTNGGTGPVLKVADLVLDQRLRRVERGGTEIRLSNREYALLEYLMLNQNAIVTRTMLAEHVWGIDFDSFSNTIDVYVSYLRAKVDAPGRPPLIHTVRGRGYCLSENRP